MQNKVLLLILDGWGNGQPYNGNAIALANKKNFNALASQYPMSELKTSGNDVGLPDGQMGNSEVGHMNIGAGRIVYQQLVLINKAFEEKTVANNTVIQEAVAYAQKNKKQLHLMGLVSDGGVHSSIEHLKQLCIILHQLYADTFFVHAFTDGRDTDPKSGVIYLEDLLKTLDKTGGQLSTVVGRYYAMDRDNRWERVKLAYDLLTKGVGESTANVIDTIKNRYAKNETDEFLKPITINTSQDKGLIKEGDVVICFNFRTDRAREITVSLTQKELPAYDLKPLDLKYITLTDYDKTFRNIQVLFPDIELNNTLGEVLATHAKKQMRIAETEKYPHVTFFFSGGKEDKFEGEERILCPSPKVATYDLKPEMSADDVCQATLDSLAKNDYDFICVNFANPDMVGHTGVLSAEIKAIEKVDDCLGKIVPVALQNGYSILVTADHGNGEYMINKEDGTPNTAHTTNKVPLLLLQPEVKYSQIKDGRLADLAPTILELMQIQKPKEMNGNSLLVS
jgi:2,3-bisphosphoglycerate-independent phosphoglycerate mutase